MSLVFSRSVRVGGTLTNADSIPTIEIIRLDTRAIVQASIAMTPGTTGRYSFELSSPIPGITYRASYTVIVNGITYTASSDQRASSVAAQADLHSLTFTDLKKEVRIALNGVPNQNMIDEGHLVNDALMQFVTSHPWAWRSNSFSLPTVAAQNYVELPEDFARLDSVTVGISNTGAAIPTTLNDIERLRVNAITVVVGSAAFYYAVNHTPQVTTSDMPEPRLELYPTPTSSTDDVFTGTYTKVPPKLTTSTDRPDVPAPFHQPLKLWIKVHSMREFHVKGWQDFKVDLDRMLADMKDEDGSDQSNLGRMEGVGTARHGDRDLRIFPTIIPRP